MRLDYSTACIVDLKALRASDPERASIFTKIGDHFYFTYQIAERLTELRDSCGEKRDDWVSRTKYSFGGASAEIYLDRFVPQINPRTAGVAGFSKNQDPIQLATSFIDPTTDKRYDLSALTLHHGSTIHGGHWTALVKVPEGEPSSGKWLLRNDNAAAQIFNSLEEVNVAMAGQLWSSVVNASYMRE